MKQVVQNLKNGQTIIEDVPVPLVRPGHLLIQSRSSVVSSGTERMLVDFGKANYLDKARQQPDKVRQVIDKVKTDGIMPTIESVRTKLDQPLPLGYCNAGEVVAIGDGVDGYAVGDRVISNGYHAEYVCVPKHLCAKIPSGVQDEDAAFTVLASISLQGIRLANPSLGECIVVSGLGLIGLLTVQLLTAQGCKVIGIDYSEPRQEIANSFGAQVVNLSKGEDPVKAAYQLTNGRGVDGVIITASTKSSEPVHQAALMCRKRGRIVLVGVTGLELSRADFYEKELSFQVSCSYGPGRYDPNYEEKGHDYPIGYVRWTEQRNFEAVLDMMAAKKLQLQPLITHRYQIDQAVEAYGLLSSGEPSLGIVLDYSQDHPRDSVGSIVQLRSLQQSSKISNGDPVVGVIGAGNFTNQILLPAIRKTNAELAIISSQGGVHGVHVGKRYGFGQTTTDPRQILDNDRINTVFITTRHNSHAHYVKSALEAGKHVFVEKPLCITREQLDELRQMKIPGQQVLMVGFNRRFAPHVKKMKELLQSTSEPKTMIMTVNAGYIPQEHWTQDLEVGGGRIIGEACHFIDLLRYLAGSPITSVQAIAVGNRSGRTVDEDKVTMNIGFADGSIGTVHYFANGHRSFPKERLDVFVAGKVLSLDNFKVLRGYGWKNFRKMKLWSQDKGHHTGLRAFIESIRRGDGNPPIPEEEIFEVTEASFDIVDLLRS